MNRITYTSNNVILHCKDWKTHKMDKKLLFSDLKSCRKFLDTLLVTLDKEMNTPSDRRLETDGRAEIYIIDDFLTEAECNALIPVIKSETRKGGVTNAANTDDDYRTAQVHDFAGIPWVQQKIADHMGIHTNFCEPLQGQVYGVGQQFKEHSDYFDPTRAKEYNHFARQQGGQRTWTFMVYLTDVDQGGETEFPHVCVSIRPVKGMAVVWDNLYTDGSNNPDTRHSSKPVIEGEKVIITQWFRTHIWERATTPEPTE